MSFFRKLFDGAYRRAQALEGRGDYRDAAAAYIEAELPDEAARMFLVLAVRESSTEEKVRAYRDALRLMAPLDQRRGRVQRSIGEALLEEAQDRGVRTLSDKRRAREAAELLEGTEAFGLAATAYELLDQMDDVARCLEAGGELERLEALLSERDEAADGERELRSLLSEFDMAMQTGARGEALTALTKAAALDRNLAGKLSDFERRFPTHHRLSLLAPGDDGSVLFVGRSSIVLGREGDVALRGSSLSRAHTRITLKPDHIFIEDLESRNGTFLRGIPIAGGLEIQGETEIRLGEDVVVLIKTNIGTSGSKQLEITVKDGLDRGMRVVAGDGPLSAPWPINIDFPSGHARVTSLAATTLLNAGRVVVPITVLTGDRIEVDGVMLEVK